MHRPHLFKEISLLPIEGWYLHCSCSDQHFSGISPQPNPFYHHIFPISIFSIEAVIVFIQNGWRLPKSAANWAYNILRRFEWLLHIQACICS
ncbi:hypothetical protein TGAM01_v210010 [Trichoderma gamsii]|uniref:Uncharacterized protein n=1 Tax=Trichoderma gamsii TaxID=398673 RepID=A0A2P4ZA61_9HYPO|nr:hypothetical protein TGAM01_v210010 [Trichoderma gamsii]PON21162.1 hypothetical protein TGAM01_v210010 [Trichoderma gamsii]